MSIIDLGGQSLKVVSNGETLGIVMPDQSIILNDPIIKEISMQHDRELRDVAGYRRIVNSETFQWNISIISTSGQIVQGLSLDVDFMLKNMTVREILAFLEKKLKERRDK